MGCDCSKGFHVVVFTAWVPGIMKGSKEHPDVMYQREGYQPLIRTTVGDVSATFGTLQLFSQGG